jgi:hypothetical protein
MVKIIKEVESETTRPWNPLMHQPSVLKVVVAKGLKDVTSWEFKSLFKV